MDLSESKILIVDDTEENIDILIEVLEDDYDIRVATDGKRALKIISEELPDLILLDIMMPELDGYQVCTELKNNPETKNIPVVFLTALSQDQDEAKGLSMGAVDYISKPFNPDLVKARVKNHLLLKMHQNNLEFIVKDRTKELEKTQAAIIKSMAILAEYRDPETGGHIKRTQGYVKLLADTLRRDEKYKEILNDSFIEILYKSAPLHDIGKVGVADSILLKKGKLTEEEFEEMKKHAVYGRDAIQASEEELGTDSFLKYAKEIAYSHHEKWDGSGYPLGLKGEEIPLSGRLMAVADVYDALISIRAYKPPFPHDKAVSIILEGKGKHFDPQIVDIFEECEDEFRQIALENADFEEERVGLRK